MTDLLIFGAFILSLAAFARTRNATDRFEAQLAALRADIAELKAGGMGQGTVLPAPVSEAEAELPVSSLPDAAIVTDQGDEAMQSAPEAEAVASLPDPTPMPVENATIPVKTGLFSGETMESLVGGRWAVWVGGVALALGGIFMVKVSIDAGLLGPGVRLILAALFGLGLIGVGEAVRRRTPAGQGAAFANAMIPGILTAAGAATLMGATYAAHGVYGFIGPSLAFFLMGAVCLCVLALSLLHGQALAGLGLAGSLVTPLLVTSQQPSPWSLFLFLTVAWSAALVTARIGRWRIVPALGNIGLGLWALIYCMSAPGLDPLPVTLCMLVMIGGLGMVWPGTADAPVDETLTADETGALLAPRPVRALFRLFLPRHGLIIITGAITALIAACSILMFALSLDAVTILCFWSLAAALGLLGATRPGAASAAVFAALIALCGTLMLMAAPVLSEATQPAEIAGLADARLSVFGLPALFILLSALPLLRSGHRRLGLVWAAVAGVTSITLCTLSFLLIGQLAIDPLHGVMALLFAAAFLALAEMVSRRSDTAQAQWRVGLLLLAMLGHLTLAALALSETLVTTLAIAVVATGFIAATRLRPWPALPWVGVAGFLIVLARYGWEPSIVGASTLGRTPVFNALLPGYGVPALLALGCAFALRKWPSARLRNALQAVACLFSLLTLALLVRHAMNGGQLEGGLPSLAEQSIYTLIVIGASAILLRLDLASPGSFLRLGGMGLGLVSIVTVLSAHLIGLNPYWTGELLGRYPVVDLLLIGYLLPGLSYAALARMASGRRPALYVAALALAGAVLAFIWATLSVRRFWQGESIADWKGFLAGETYTYSVVWLVMGVALLALGSRFNARSLRIASAVLVFFTVLKVFLIDMSNLEGVLRALSFMGLGAVLIGIGLFYQKILSRPSRSSVDPLDPPGEGEAA